MMPTTAITKVAVRHREGSPRGSSAQMFLVCPCGKEHDVEYPHGPVIRCDCGRAWKSTGWAAS